MYNNTTNKITSTPGFNLLNSKCINLRKINKIIIMFSSFNFYIIYKSNKNNK